MPRWENGFQTSEEIQRYKRYAVIREAARIMSRRGFHNTSLDEIAKVLGISKGTLYNYVEDKQAILFECHNIALDLGEHAARVANAAGGTGIDRLRLLLKCYMIWMYGQAGIGGITFDVNALRPDDRETIVRRRDAMEATLVALLEESIADDSVRVGDVSVAVYAIMSAVNGISTWFSIDGRLSIDRIADQILDTVTLSLATRPGELTRHLQIPAYPAQDTPLNMFNRPVSAARRQKETASGEAGALRPRGQTAVPRRPVRATIAKA